MTRERLNTFMTFIMPFRTRKHWLVHNRIIIIAHFIPLKIRLQSSTRVFSLTQRWTRIVEKKLYDFSSPFRSAFLAIFFLKKEVWPHHIQPLSLCSENIRKNIFYFDDNLMKTFRKLNFRKFCTLASKREKINKKLHWKQLNSNGKRR